MVPDGAVEETSPDGADISRDILRNTLRATYDELEAVEREKADLKRTILDQTERITALELQVRYWNHVAEGHAHDLYERARKADQVAILVNRLASFVNQSTPDHEPGGGR